MTTAQADGGLIPDLEAEARAKEKAAVWAEWRRYLRDTAEQGGLVNQSQAARFVGCSATYINKLVHEGRLRSFSYRTLDVHNVVAARDVADLKLKREKEGRA